MSAMKDGTIVIIGSGLIGRSWAMVFASAGYKVKIYDIVQQQVTNALEEIRYLSEPDGTQTDADYVEKRWWSNRDGGKAGSNDSLEATPGCISRKQMEELKTSGMLRGTLGTEKQVSLITGCTDLKTALDGAVFIQECIPENLELKQKIFGELDVLANPNTIFSSSTSCLSPVKIFTGLKHVKKSIVSHPVNPPYYVPLVELVPHPETDPATVETTYVLMKEIGQSPVKLLKDIDGFVLNRLQYAVISEAWRLVKEGVVSPTDVDTVMSEGLGMRYAFLGPLETAHLNAEGFGSYCQRYGEGIHRVVSSFGPVPEFSGEVLEKINQALCQKVPADAEHLAARRDWRDACLGHLAKLKKEMS